MSALTIYRFGFANPKCSLRREPLKQRARFDNSLFWLTPPDMRSPLVGRENDLGEFAG